ncbi:hypothetical protein PFISCL1PPCAC_21138, partial [Pristionchus fissidentatus]
SHDVRTALVHDTSILNCFHVFLVSCGEKESLNLLSEGLEGLTVGLGRGDVATSFLSCNNALILYVGGIIVESEAEMLEAAHSKIVILGIYCGVSTAGEEKEEKIHLSS